MIYNAEIAKTLADYLLQIKAIKLSPQMPFTWASGWKSPIYCDNRLTLSYPVCRQYIKESLTALSAANFSDVDVVAGVATAGIAHGALLADHWNKPFAYVRSAPKGHGLSNQIEGRIEPGQKVLVVEDLISTGKSSLEVVEAIRKAGGEVVGMVAIFTYGFQAAEDAFAAAQCPYYTLSDYSFLIELAVEKGYLKPEEVAHLQEWRKNPSSWGQ